MDLIHEGSRSLTENRVVSEKAQENICFCQTVQTPKQSVLSLYKLFGVI